MMDKFKKKHTLCWDCANSNPNPETGKGCKWSVYNKPVDGWEATETVIISRPDRTAGESRMPSFIVVGCPEFDRDSFDGGMKWANSAK